VYTPGPKRVHGYYTLPILHHGRLVGRLDAKAHRAEHRLEVRHAHFEPWFASAQPLAGWGRVDQDEALAGLGEALGSLATFVGAAEVALSRVTPRQLQAPLGRMLRGVARVAT
ncbi:MAG TPA: crosslink repair DNA glycosylase YcaQ family protein, partial [Methylomirabilota bacterium]|nr:crosslink repair DNA glycosylase YcaQ family protein [Methylomirabilota bacterium]